MSDFIEFYSALNFWLKEKIILRKYLGKSRLNNFGSRKRNDAFYKKLEIEIVSILEKDGYKKKKKRVFVKDNTNSSKYLIFALNKKLNGLCIDYGEIHKEEEPIRFIKNDYKFQRLKPLNWNYDYQYPVYKNDKKDELIIQEIKELLLIRLNIS